MSVTVAVPEETRVATKAGKTLDEVQAFVGLVKRAMKPCAQRIGVAENGILRYYMVERRGLGVLNTAYGEFWQYNFAIDDQWGDYAVLVKAGLNEASLVPVFTNNAELVLRTDCGCTTGQVFGDLTCECGPQLEKAMELIAKVGEGMIVNIPRQDGRGMGLPFKLATLWLQHTLHVNTVESAGMLAPGGVIDVRTYSGVVAILRFFGVEETCKINLATNNPEKVAIFGENGYFVNGNTPIVIKPTEYTAHHLAAKQEHLGHVGLVEEEKK